MSLLTRLALRKWRVSTVDVQDTHILSAADDSPPRTEWNLDDPEELAEWAAISARPDPSRRDTPLSAFTAEELAAMDGTTYLMVEDGTLRKGDM